jgi:tight adherence protein C
MALALSVLMFLFIASVSYLFGMKFWVSPQNVLERVIGEARQTEARHPSMAFRDALVKIGEMLPSSPTDLGVIQKRLYAAGLRAPIAFKVFLGVKVLSTLAMPLVMWIACRQFGIGSDSQLMLLVLAGCAGYMGPSEALNFLVKRRRKKIGRALPNALDPLVVCVESGLGLDQAITQVSRELNDGYPELSQEFAITNLEMRHGKGRAEALRNLGERSDVADVKKLVSTLIQADRFGTSIAQTLRTHADFMRMTARQRAEEKAAKMGIKLVFPIFFCILPSLFVVTVGPVIVTIFTELIPMMNGT